VKKNKQKIIVAVSGGFDPLHIGHVRMFQEAKKLGDELVVILNNDNWVKAKKGFVFMPQEERKEIIEALGCVDRVILTNHPLHPQDMSVCAELRRLKPHIFANGGDRIKDNVPEVAVCKAINCKMVFNVGWGGKVQSSSWMLNKYAQKLKLQEKAASLTSKKVLVFDLDGTLTKSKANLDQEMASLLCELLKKKVVAVMGGGSYAQFKNQFLKYLKCSKEQLKNLYLLPVSGGSFYSYRHGGWHLEYNYAFKAKEKKKIFYAFKLALRDISYNPPQKTYGKIIEDRHSQITFSALGQKAPLEKKKEWHEKADIRPQLQKALKKYLPEFEIRLGGLTSIDITKKGIDKAYGIKQLAGFLSLPKGDIVYIGDALYRGGNDYAVRKAKVDTLQIKDEEETKQFIRFLLLSLKRSSN
jgi:HAD superfamily hydrolase (TIGR01484 family)